MLIIDDRPHDRILNLNRKTKYDSSYTHVLIVCTLIVLLLQMSVLHIS